MSYWTHVCGCIRVDSLRLNKEDNQKDNERIEEVLGKIIQFDDIEWDWNITKKYKTKLPMGSEGSLKYSIMNNPLYCIAAHVITIWGDLRDYGEEMEDIQYIEDWFNDVCSKFNIRQAVLTISGGCLDESKTITYNEI